MDLDNNDAATSAESETSAPRKRVSRRVSSATLGEKAPEKAADTITDRAPSKATARKSQKETGPTSEAKQQDFATDNTAEASNTASGDATERPRRRRASGSAKTESTDAPSESNDGSQDSESGDDNGDDNGDGGGYNRGRGRGRGRDRDRRRGRGGYSEDGEPEVADDDVLIPIGGILDVLDNYAFVRTQGYLPGSTDVYVSLGQVKKYNLRKGDAVIGAIRQPRDGEHQGRQKYNALVSIDSVNGQTVDEAASRVEFSALSAVYPTERYRMETTSAELTGRMVDVFAPVGKGQRGVVVGKAGTGKSGVMSALAQAVSLNAPDVHVMVVLIDEQPEAITEIQREAKGEVIASTFDRSSDDHTTIAELAIERAKRLVELGHDVVVLFDSLTRLARAYQQSIGGTSRGGSVDTAWVHPTKKLFGAARNVEGGGSLTILGTLVTATGLAVDDVVASEISGTATWELHLDGACANSRMFPAIDIQASQTRRDDLLLAASEATAIAGIRKAVAGSEPTAALQIALDGMKKSSSNVEFLVAMGKHSSGPAN